MELDAYLDARRTMLVRTGVLLGRPPARSEALVESVLAGAGRAIRRSSDPDPHVLAALLRAVVADRATSRDEEEPVGRADHAPRVDEEGLAVRRRLAALPAEVRDVAVLAYGTQLGTRDLAEVLGVHPRGLPTLAAAALTALGAVDEHDARHRLALAGETVPTGSPRPVAAGPPPPGRPPVGAAARRGGAARRGPVVLLLVLAGLAIALSLTLPGEAPPQRRARPTVEELPRTLRGDQVPSLFGYRLPAASARLHRFVLKTSVERVTVCEPPDVVLATSPGVGATFRPGETLSIVVARRDVRPCPGYRDRAAAWAFLGFAAGHEGPPAFAPRVTVVLDDASPVVLTRGQARDRRRWGPALATVAAAMGRIGLDAATYVTPSLTVRAGRPAGIACGLSPPPRLARRPALELSLALPTEVGGCPPRVDLYRTHGRVDGVVVRSARRPGGETQVASP